MRRPSGRVIGLTKSLAIELGPYNVRCNAICPGSVRGDRINRVIQGEADMRGVPFEVVAKEMVGPNPSRALSSRKRLPTCACSSPRPAAKMITGQDIAIDGHLETFHIR